MTVKKNSKPAEVEAVEDEILEPTPVEVEVQEESTEEEKEDTRRRFTVEVDGEDVTLIDMWERDQPPAALAMISKPQYAERYMVSLLEQLVGEDQLIHLISVGADVEELGAVVAAWSEARGAKN